MPNETDYALEQEQVEALATLLGLDVTPSRSSYGLERQQRDLLLLLAQKGLGQTIDTSPPPEEDVPLPPVEDNDPEPDVIEPVIIAVDNYIPDLTSYSPYNKPRLSAASGTNYFPPALTGVPGASRFMGVKFSGHTQDLAFWRLEIPLRRKFVLGGEQFALLILKKIGDKWVTVGSRFATLRAQQARLWWFRTTVIPKGEEWAIIFGVNGSAGNIFYGAATPYPAPYTGIGYDAELPSSVGTPYALTDVSGGHRMIRLYGVNLPKDVIGPLSAEDLPAGTGGGGASLARANVALTTPSIAAGAQHSADLNLGGSFLVQSVTTSHPARVRLYRTTAARTADASRAASADPTDAIAPYLLLEAIAPLGSDFTIPANVAAAAPATNGVIYALFDNRDTVSRAITATFSNLTLERVG